MFAGKADPKATQNFLMKREVHPDQQRKFCGIPVSSLGVGTYLGPMDEVTDMKVALACVSATDSGSNFFDTAINYRGQRAERSIGEALRRGILAGKFNRQEIFISSKAGFIPFEREATNDIKKLFEEVYVKPLGIASADLVGGVHCMHPKYLQNQIDRSRKNLSVETIDLYYLHNPEIQLEETSERVFYANLVDAFVAMEIAIKEGKIASYGMATWNGFRDEPTQVTSLQLEKCMEAAKLAAKKAGVDQNGFKAVQLPLNIAMIEGAVLPTQKFGDNLFPAIDAAHDLGLSVAVSVPLFQGRLCHGMPEFILENFPKTYSQAHAALGFATAFSSVDAAMVGMKGSDHVSHNLELLRKPRLPATTISKTLSSISG